MSDFALLVIAVSAFVAGHELMSHPLRAPLVKRLGAGGFALAYSIVAFATLGWAVSLWRAIPADRIWQAPPFAYALALVAMLFAAILFVGSVTAPNPALMGNAAASGGPRGVQRITRHPMMWSFAIWAAVHITVSGDGRTIVLASGILVLALYGASMQDRKKRAASPDYGAHEAVTGFMPFGAQISGRSRWATATPGWIALIGGIILWAGLLWGHPLVIGVPAIQIG